MAQKVEIWRTGAGAYTDYSTWLTALDDHITKKTHRLNELQEFEFILADGLASFQVPEAGNRVRVQTDNYPNWFTGYLLRTPKREFIGKKVDSNNPVYGYRCHAASEELRLDWQTAATFPTGRIPALPAGILPAGFAGVSGAQYRIDRPEIHVHIDGGRVTPTGVADVLEDALLILGRRRAS